MAKAQDSTGKSDDDTSVRDSVQKDAATVNNDSQRHMTAKTRKILLDADRRDDEADARDIVSDERAQAADRQAFLDAGESYSGQQERRSAAVDRAQSKEDRNSSAEDRTHLTEADSVEDQTSQDD